MLSCARCIFRFQLSPCVRHYNSDGGYGRLVFQRREILKRVTERHSIIHPTPITTRNREIRLLVFDPEVTWEGKGRQYEKARQNVSVNWYWYWRFWKWCVWGHQFVFGKVTKIGRCSLWCIEIFTQQSLLVAAIVESLKEHNSPPRRPEVFEPSKSDTVMWGLLYLMEQCWHESPDLRPTIIQAKALFAKAIRVKNLDSAGSLFDRVMRRLGRYHGELEILVAERTHDYLVERARCDTVLQEMFPK